MTAHCSITALLVACTLPVWGHMLTKCSFLGSRALCLRVPKAASARRCHVNGVATSLRVLRELGLSLVDVNGQHAAQTLRQDTCSSLCKRLHCVNEWPSVLSSIGTPAGDGLLLLLYLVRVVQRCSDSSIGVCLGFVSATLQVRARHPWMADSLTRTAHTGPHLVL